MPGMHNDVKPTKDDGSTSGHVSTTEEFRGPTESRECRDITFLVLFATFIAGMIFVSYRGGSLGNPYRIIYGTDSWGNVCNRDNPVIPGVRSGLTGLDMTRRPYMFFFNELIFDSVLNSAMGKTESVKICVSECPSNIRTIAELRKFTAHLCVYDVPVQFFFNGNKTGLSDCPPLPIAELEPFLHRCIPVTLTRRVDHVIETMANLLDTIDEKMMEKGARDLQNSWFEMLILCILAVFVSLVITLLIQFVTAVIVWFMVTTLATGSVIATGVTWHHYRKLSSHFESLPEVERTPHLEKTVQDWLIGAICTTVIMILALLVLIAVRKYIAMVVALFKQAGIAIRQMPSLLMHPLITVLFIGTLFGGLATMLIYIETSGIPRVDEKTGFVSIEPDQAVAVLKWFFLFGIIWIVQFVNSCHKMIVASAVALWYFSRQKKSLRYPVAKSTWRLIRYHLGSVALGSLFITFVVYARMLISFVESRLQGKTDPVSIFLLKCFKCCLWCFEKFLKLLNNNAYIEIAIHGYGFCKAARRAFRVVMMNAMSLAAINSVGDFVLFLGKSATVAIVTVVGIEWISARKTIHYVWLPVTLVAIASYFIASCFISVNEMAIDTIFVCFCEDSAMNDGDTKPYYMSKGLRKCMAENLDRYKTRNDIKNGQSRTQCQQTSFDKKNEQSISSMPNDHIYEDCA